MKEEERRHRDRREACARFRDSSVHVLLLSVTAAGVAFRLWNPDTWSYFHWVCRPGNWAHGQALLPHRPDGDSFTFDVRLYRTD